MILSSKRLFFFFFTKLTHNFIVMLYTFCKMPKSLLGFTPKLHKGTQSKATSLLRKNINFNVCIINICLNFYFITFLFIKLISVCGGNYGNNIIK